MLCWFVPYNNVNQLLSVCVCLCVCTPFLLSLLPNPHPPLSRHRRPGGVPCIIQQLPTSYFTHGKVNISMLLSQSAPPCPSPAVSRCSLIDEWIKKLWCIYNGMLLSHKKE